MNKKNLFEMSYHFLILQKAKKFFIDNDEIPIHKTKSTSANYLDQILFNTLNFSHGEISIIIRD